MFAYVKDRFVPQNEAVISIAQRGFRFGDGVFETMRVQNGKMYQQDKHIIRLSKGLEALKITSDLTALPEICDQLVQKNKFTEGIMRLSVSRGEGSLGYLPNVTDGALWVIETMALPPVIKEPVDLWLSRTYSVSNLDLGGAKTMQGLGYILAKIEASEQGCCDALMMTAGDIIGEGSSANVFWFKGGVLFTPQLQAGMVGGTIRDALLRLSPYEVRTGEFALPELLEADEIFLTNVAQLVVPVKEIKPLGKVLQSFDVAAKLKKLLLEDVNHATA